MNAQFTAFVSRHRLKGGTDVDLTAVVRGSRGQIFDYGDGRIAVMVQPGRSSVWPRTRKKLIDAGFEIPGGTQFACSGSERKEAGM